MVLAQFCTAVCPIVQRFDVVVSAILHFIRVIIYGGLETFHLTIDEATVRVDDRIACIKINGLIKVVDRVLKPAIINREFLKQI